jgi:outer membrane protein assembly factor BamB
MQTQAPTPTGVLYIGAGKFVAAIDAVTGVELWRTKLPEGSGTVLLLFSSGCLFASAQGHVYRLAPEDGSILWHNGLPRMGLGLVTMTFEGLETQHAAAAEEAAKAARAAHSAAG